MKKRKMKERKTKKRKRKQRKNLKMIMIIINIFLTKKLLRKIFLKKKMKNIQNGRIEGKIILLIVIRLCIVVSLID